ncbi:Crp/Fnr family transcriptional regulator [Roseicyclus sp.]|jgi:CRP-like cAMP-binding protein|uniref:Crp/Fnr family transcriptional regulator n=1 Tax=Roseicyclus sp. TaxID=1914329 RepID=UPI001BCC94B3|nr:cyclic nucleotide-binding domain-containing protein [Roseicyclus sp.]
MQKRDFPKNSNIFKKGDKPDGLYVIGSGTVGIFFPTNYEMKIPDITLGATEIFGEMGIIDTAPRMATARALEDSVIIFVSETDFNSLLTQSHVIVRGVMAILSDRLRELQKRR